MIESFKCKYCDRPVPFIDLRKQDFEILIRTIPRSKTLAVAELKYSVDCTESEATAWLDHFLNCAYTYPLSEADKEILDIVDGAFSHVPKPVHFTDYMHCAECEEHDNTFLKGTRETVRRGDLGNVGWDPVTFTSAEGIAYLFPVLARYALIPSLWISHDWYGSQLLTHLSRSDHNNGFLAWCGSHQREAVYSLLKHLAVTRLPEIENYLDRQELSEALSAWQEEKK